MRAVERAVEPKRVDGYTLDELAHMAYGTDSRATRAQMVSLARAVRLLERSRKLYTAADPADRRRRRIYHVDARSAMRSPAVRAERRPSPTDARLKPSDSSTSRGRSGDERFEVSTRDGRLAYADDLIEYGLGLDRQYVSLAMIRAALDSPAEFGGKAERARLVVAVLRAEGGLWARAVALRLLGRTTDEIAADLSAHVDRFRREQFVDGRSVERAFRRAARR